MGSGSLINPTYWAKLWGTYDIFDPKNTCKLCGGEYSVNDYMIENTVGASLCRNCNERFTADYSFNEWIKANVHDDFKCIICGFHVNACECPHRQALEKMTK